jgi:hypothetical protein
MKETNVFLDEIAETARRLLLQYHDEIEGLDTITLAQKPEPDKWSVLECLEHINLANQNYLSQMDEALAKAGGNPKKYHKSGWIAQKSIRMMRPGKNQKIRWKMNTMPVMQPETSVGEADKVLKEFTRQVQHIADIAERARSIDIGRPRIKTALGPLTFNFGDALAFIAVHAERHMLQALNTKEAVVGQTSEG